MKFISLSKAALVLLGGMLLSGTASAAVIVDLFGDKDGFGIGVQAGEGFNWSDVGPGDGNGTDVWFNTDITYSHTFDLSNVGPIVDAKLEIFTGGQGYQGLSQLFIDGVFAGELTDGDDIGPDYNYAILDVFQLTDFTDLLDGASEIRIDTMPGDGWVLDYSELTIYTSDATVPAPATIGLLGLVVLGLARRFK